MPRTALLSATILLAALTLACDDGDSTPTATPTPLRAWELSTIEPGMQSSTSKTLEAQFSNDTTVLDLLRDIRDDYRPSGWYGGTPMPTPRAEVAAAAIDRKIYVVGGFTENGQNTNIVEVYDTETDTWSSITPMPERLDHAMAAAANGKLYVIGGWRVFGEQASDAVYEYDPTTARWRTAASLPLPRAAGAAASDGSTIYVVGGVGPDSVVALGYDVRNDKWSRRGVIAEPREHLAAAVVGSKVYAIGGRWNDRGNVSTVEEYDPETNIWTEREPMPTARGGLAAAANGTVIHVVGGESFGTGSKTFNEHEAYRPEHQLMTSVGDEWNTLAPLPTARHGLAAAVVGDRLYVIAGGETPGLSVSGYVEIYEPLPPLPRIRFITPTPSSDE